MAAPLDIVGSDPVVTGTLLVAAAGAILVLQGILPSAVLWLAYGISAVVLCAELIVIARTRLTT